MTKLELMNFLKWIAEEKKMYLVQSDGKVVCQKCASDPNPFLELVEEYEKGSQ